MNILVCFKIVPELELLSHDDWTADSNLTVDVSFVKSIWNCFDESALEMMLKLSDLSEGFDVSYHLNALTIGGTKCDTYLKTLYALGYEKAIRVHCNEDIRFVPEKIAFIIAEYVKNNHNQDVIVMGSQSSEGDNGKTPFLTAELLGWSCISQVIEVEPVSEKSLKVTSMSDIGILTQIIKTPCVLSVGNAPNSYIRVPTLKDRMKSSKKEIELWQTDDFKMNDEEVTSQLIKLENVFQERNGFLIEGETPQEKAKILYERYLKGRLNKL